MAFSFKYVILFIYVILLILTSTASLLDKECLALFEFKQSILYQDYASLDAGGFHKFDSWGNITSNASHDSGSDHCCLWDGVVCSNEGHVIGIDLGESLLSGRINSNSTLFDLVHLQTLNLSMNNFSESQIPSEIARLKQLTSLDLSYSGFYGQIPNEISYLTKLSLLDLSWNSLKLQTPSRLLQNLTRLEELDLSGVNISSSVPRFLANFSSLRSIKLRSCGLYDKFPSEVFHLPKLKLLSVAVNPNLTGSLPEFGNNTLFEHLNLFSTGFSGIVPESISNLNQLVFLALSGCYFSGRIPDSLSNLTQLTNLGLGQNEFTGQVPSLGSLSKLLVLELNDNEFTKGPMPDWIGKLTHLDRLHLNRMNIYDEILPSLANLTKLSLVSIRENFIFAPIPPSFMNLTQLAVIDLRGNQLQGSISSSFSNFKSLEYLSLDYNNFSGTVNLDTFVGLNKLESLYLGDNRISFVSTKNYTDGILPELMELGLSSCNLREFPPFLRFQNKLVTLLLDQNKIDGLVPVWIWNISHETLQMLDLSYNFITGFPKLSQFLPWVHLEAFSIPHNQLQGRLPIPPQTIVFYDFSKNNLTGEIPPLLCEAKSLRLLDLSSNKMTGTLPPCIGNLSSSLSVLDLKRNNFHGTMMNTFTYGSQLKRIELSENRFVGQIPKSLANCTRLEVLSLGDNSFDDIFPFWLGALEELKVLILRSNKFYGAVQSPTTNKSHFSKLQIIDLSNNGFTGHLPDKYFQSWNAMKSAYAAKALAMSLEVNFGRGQFGRFTRVYPYSMTLTNKGVKREYERILNIFTSVDLSSNNFEGQIPQSLQELRGLQSLNLSNNDLTGRVLTSLGNLKNLESLDLSQNKMSGKIPQELLQLGFLAIVNVSKNLLDGRIPQGKQFNTFENSSYMGNPGLCGQPLSNECEDSKATTPSLTSNNESEPGSLLPTDGIDWIVIFSGVVCGFVTGIIFLRSRFARYSDWIIERFGLKKDRWVRPLRNTRRN